MERTSPKSEVIAISLSDLPEDVEFKKNVCYPYFKDIYKVGAVLTTRTLLLGLMTPRKASIRSPCSR